MMGKIYNNLISTTAGFNYASEQPLDDRTVVKRYSDLAELVNSNVSYEGIEVYVVDDKKSYKLINSEWKPIATEEYVDSTVVNQINSAMATKITTPPTASVGQILVVKAVDENGRPTDWEAVDYQAPDGSSAIALTEQEYEDELVNGKIVSTTYYYIYEEAEP